MAQPREIQSLRREVGLLGAVGMGLGSIVGTGVFVSLAAGAEAAGPAVLLAVAAAAGVAACNGLSSAQLAANFPVSGGTYEYGRRLLNPTLGFLAGWMFLCAKSASAATAALGLAGYLLRSVGVESTAGVVLLALGVILAMTLLVLTGIRRSSAVNLVIVAVTVVSLAAFVGAGLPSAWRGAEANLFPLFAPVEAGASPLGGFLEGAALMFVAFTGYGRIATLGEEIREPRRNIPRAILLTLAAALVLYLAVAGTALATAGAEKFAAAGQGTAAPLAVIAGRFELPGVPWIVTLGAVTAMLGVLLNLVLGLSRVVLAMARHGDLPSPLARVSESNSTPAPAVLLVGLLTAVLALAGDVKATWSFSAFTVLVYYAVTNLAALRLTAAQRLYPRPIAWTGLVACLFLAGWVQPTAWLAGMGLLAVGVVWHRLAAWMAGGERG